MAALLAAIVVFGVVRPAPSHADTPADSARAVVPFERVRLSEPEGHSNLLAYTCLATGLALCVASFPLGQHADDLYDQYLNSANPTEITSLYDETVKYDRLASGALISGEALLGMGLYLRFLRHHEPRVDMAIGPARCVVSYRF